MLPIYVFFGLPGLEKKQHMMCKTQVDKMLMLQTQNVTLVTTKSWMPSFVRRESELTLSFAMTLQIQRIMARHYAGDGSVYPPSWPKSLLHVASHSLHMMSTPYLWSEGALGGW